MRWIVVGMVVTGLLAGGCAAPATMAAAPKEGGVKPVVFYDGGRGYAGVVLRW
jgi:hypothetical protein